MRPSQLADRRSVRVVGALLAAAVLAIGGAGLAPTAAAATPLGDLTFYGRGYGHGVGMSQYGARGRALAGQTAEAILAHYYAGTTIGTRDPATNVRVLVLTAYAATSAAPLTIIGTGDRWSIDGIASPFPAGARALLFPVSAGSTTWTLRVRATDGTILHESTVTSAVMIRPAPGTTSLPLGSVANHTIRTRTSAATSFLQLASKAGPSNVYRGALRVSLGTKASVVNHVALDDYLRGVVPTEMPASWPVEALDAQAIAARSYAVFHLHPATGTFDVYDDTRSQVYRGRNGEAASTDLAVSSTAGAVLLSGSKVANAVFHSADGGATENNENVWTSSTGEVTGTPLPYLRGSSDRAPDGSAYDKASPYATWHTATYSAAKLGAMFALDSRTNVGTLKAIDLSNRGVSGRLISVTLTGSLGSKTVSGEIFRSVFNARRPSADPQLRSTLFDTAPIP
jgi:stage II sporulation protein D